MGCAPARAARCSRAAATAAADVVRPRAPTSSGFCALSAARAQPATSAAP